MHACVWGQTLCFVLNTIREVTGAERRSSLVGLEPELLSDVRGSDFPSVRGPHGSTAEAGVFN